jgi:hypothetical protein
LRPFQQALTCPIWFTGIEVMRKEAYFS